MYFDLQMQTPRGSGPLPSAVSTLTLARARSSLPMQQWQYPGIHAA